MKTYSIGRDLNCDIVINDTTDVISRRHALLNVTPSGKMTIIDQSSNGTYVNGIRISPNVPVPVTRKDVISLAHVAKLDWNQIPKSNQWVKYLLGAIAALVVIALAVIGIRSYVNHGGQGDETQVTAPADTTEMAKKKAAELDSIKKAAAQDSIKAEAEKAKKDSVQAKAKSKTQPKQKDKAKSKPVSKDKDKKKDGSKDSKKEKRTIG